MNAPKVENDQPIDPQPKTLGIVQITRFGDLLQTYTAAKELKEQRPDLRLVLIARKSFAAPLAFLLQEVFDEVYCLDYDKMIAGASGLEDIRVNLKDFLAQVNQTSIDVLINLSFSVTAEYLTSLIPSKFLLGPVRNAAGQLSINDKWSKFVYSNVMRGDMNPFSLVDIFKMILGVELKAPDVVQIKNKTVQNIVIHPFASHARKHWKSAKWVELLYKTFKENPDAEISIVGSETEVPLSNEIANNPVIGKFQKRLMNRTGQTSIKELYALLKESDLFIGHDSMVGHLAAVANIPSVTISLGSVRPNETTPYSRGAFNIAPKTKCFPCFPQDQCDFYQCHADINHQVVYSTIEQIMRNGEVSVEKIEKENSTFYLNSVNIYNAFFRSSQLFSLEPLNKDYADIKSVMRVFYRMGWLYLFEEKEENYGYPVINENVYNQLLQVREGLKNLKDLGEFGKKYSQEIIEVVSSETPDITRIKSLGDKIDEIDKLQDIISESFPLLAPLVDYFKIEKANLKGNNIVQLSESSFYAYNNCSTLSSILSELIEKTISEFKINYSQIDKNQKVSQGGQA